MYFETAGHTVSTAVEIMAPATKLHCQPDADIPAAPLIPVPAVAIRPKTIACPALGTDPPAACWLRGLLYFAAVQDQREPVRSAETGCDLRRDGGI